MAARHSRRLRENVRNAPSLSEWCATYDIELSISNAGHHWKFKWKTHTICQWWPSSAKFVYAQDYNNSLHVHDYQQVCKYIKRALKRCVEQNPDPRTVRCPIHDVPLKVVKTRYGLRHNCTVEFCSVAMWDGSTSTPATKEVRDARKRAHAAFDPLWKDGDISRGTLYKQLASFMGLTNDRCHIGYFDEAQCDRVIEFVGEFNAHSV